MKLREETMSLATKEDDSHTAKKLHTISAAGRTLDLPIIPVDTNLAIALFMSIDAPISFVQGAGEALATKLQTSCSPEVVVTAATLGIPVGIAVAKGLGLDRVIVLQKTNKIHLQDALTEPLKSITTSDPQLLRLDRAQIPNLKGKRVVFVDDVISSGGSVKAALQLIRKAEGKVVGIGAVLVEGTGWKSRIGDEDAALVHWLDKIPLFRRSGDDDGWKPDYE